MPKRYLILLSLGISFFVGSAFASLKVKIAIADFKPYIDLDANDYGWHSKIILNKLKQQQIELELVFYSWARITRMLNLEKVCSFGFLKSDERTLKWQFSNPYITFEQHIWGRKDRNIRLSSIDDLKAYTVGITSNFSYGQGMDDMFKKEVAVDESLADEIGVRKLIAGRVDLMPAGKVVMQALLARYYPDEKNTIESKLKVASEKLYFVCSKDYPQGSLAISKLNQSLGVSSPPL